MNDILTSTNCQIVNETFESTFHIIRHSDEDYAEFFDLFIGSPQIACKSFDCQVLKSNLDSIQPMQYHSIIQIMLNINNTKNKTTSPILNNNMYLFNKANRTKFSEELDNFSLSDFSTLDKNHLLKN